MYKIDGMARDMMLNYPYDEHLIDAMIACKEMVEALIQEPVNLQQNGKVTIGF